jgi:hypothetical protein
MRAVLCSKSLMQEVLLGLDEGKTIKDVEDAGSAPKFLVTWFREGRGRRVE